MSFSLHPQLAADTVLVGDLPLSQVLLMNNAHFPWLILVPRKSNLRELHDLEIGDYNLLTQEMRFVAHAFQAHTKADKMNVAALGNMVPQLHIHIIARFAHDAAWPNPVWNSGTAPRPYSPAALEAHIRELKTLLLSSH